MVEINYEGLKFPVNITDVSKLEKMNSDISINVLFYENRNPSPLYNSPDRSRKHHVNLLLIMDEKSGTSHYLLIWSLSRLVDDRTNHKVATHICPYCLYCFSTEHFLRSHLPECSIHPPQRLEYQTPKHDGDTAYNILKFKNFAKTLPVPMVLYYDFEIFLVSVEDNGTASNIVTKELHKPSGFSCLRVAQDPSTPEIYLHTVCQM